MSIAIFSRICLFSITLPWLTGCLFPEATSPMPMADYRDGAKQHPNLIVFLHGRGGSPEHFERYGFVSAVQERQLPYDMLAPSAHMGYYVKRTFVERLRDDVILPAKAAGYEQIWLVGVSMGGLGSLLFSSEYAEHLTGIVLISPYLGIRPVIDEIEQAGGLKAWNPEPEGMENWQQYLWLYIKRETASPTTGPALYLAYGESDKHLQACELLRQALPADHVLTLPGRHTDEVFFQLWQQTLNHGALPSE